MAIDTMQGLSVGEETLRVQVAEATDENAAQKENAPEFVAHEASVACATTQYASQYVTEASACQVSASPFADPGQENVTLDEIETVIADAARKRIEAAHRELEDTRSRIERERTAHENALHAMQARVSQMLATLDGLADERTAMESRARAFLGGDTLRATLGQIHLAFNVRQLELEAALATSKADAADAQTEVDAARVSDGLELQLAEQELERLESAAPQVAQALQQAAAISQIIASARQSIQDGMLRDAAALIDQAKKTRADPFVTTFIRPQDTAEDQAAAIGELESALADAQKAQLARNLVARLSAACERPGALKRIRKITDEAAAASVGDQIVSAVARAQQVARHAANERFGQARPIADHLVVEGYVPVVGDGRIEAWKPASHNNHSDGHRNDGSWMLDRIVVLRANGVWVTAKPRVAVTRKTLAPYVKRSRWYRTWCSKHMGDAERNGASDPAN